MLDRLISQGYRNSGKNELSLKDLLEQYDAYFDIGEEPGQMALGVDGTIILIGLENVYPSAHNRMKKRILILDNDTVNTTLSIFSFLIKYII